MARKNPLIKVKDVKELYYSYNKDDQLEYFIRFKPKGKNPFPIRNYTEIFNLYDLEDKKHLKEVIKLRDYTHSKFENEGIYYIDEITGKLEKQEAKEQEAKEQKKIDVLFNSIYEIVMKQQRLAETTAKSYEANYNRHIKPFLGGTSVYDIEYADIEKIFVRMDNENENGTGNHVKHKKSGKIIMKNPVKKLSLQTKKNVLTIFRKVFNYLNDDEKEFKDFYFEPSKRILKKINNENNNMARFAPLHVRLQIRTSIEMLNIVRKIYQEINKMIKITYKKDGTKKIIPSDRQRTQAYFYTSLMTARRISELQRIEQSNIKEDTVFVNPETTKTKIYDSFLLPPEVIKINNLLQDKYPFKIAYGTANRNWHIIKENIKMENIEFRQYDFRHLFVSIMSEYYDRETLGLCISHTSGDDMKSNEYYFSLILERKKEVFEKYWELIREPISN
jgi:integrase